MVINYDTVKGQLIGENSGGLTTTYLADELGSVARTASAGSVVNAYNYSPYGSLLAKSGKGADPRFMWVGGRGYLTTGRTQSEDYIRARHYSTTAGQWTTVDGAWPYQPRYGYAAGSPASLGDASGLSPVKVYFNSFIHKAEDDAHGTQVPGHSGVWIKGDGAFGLRYFQGDHRGFFEGGTARVRSWLRFDHCQIGDLSNPEIQAAANSDRSYGLFGPRLEYRTGTAIPVFKYNVILNQCDRNTGAGLSVIQAWYWAAYPLIPAVAWIRVSLNVEALRDSSGNVTVIVSGTHTKYPWQESSLQIGSVLGHVYTWDADVGNLPWGLWEETIYRTGSAEVMLSPCCCP